MVNKNKDKLFYFISKKLDYPFCPPKNITVTLNYLCNQNCIMCGIKNLPFDKKYEITVKEMKNIIDEMVVMNIPELVLTGGEPFLYNGIFEVIDYAKDKGLKVIMITNGFYDAALFNKILNCKADHFQISLDGSNREIYESIRGAKDSFDIVIDNIKKFIGNGKSIGVTATVTKQNYKDLLNIALLAKDLGCSRLALRPAHVNNADPLKRDFEHAVFWIPPLEIDTFKSVVEDLKRFNAQTNFLDFSPGIELLVDYFKNGYLPPLGSCYIGFTRLIISYNEKNSYGIWMCRDMLGDIRKNSLKEIWYGAKSKEIRKIIRKCNRFCLFPENHEPELKSLRSLVAAVINKGLKNKQK